MPSFFIAATGQNVGKTTLSLGLFAGLQKRLSSVGFFKPVGQESLETPNGQQVDKDVLLFKDYFSLEDPYESMSPVLFPKGFTRDYLDGKILSEDLFTQIQISFQTLSKRHSTTIVEGTGHTAVGSIVDLNNAQVAQRLQLPLILIASGGLGSSFDALSLNYTQCKAQKAHVAGVILNRVLPHKQEMVCHYMKKALSRWNIPLLGSIPYDPFLSSPTMQDFQTLFEAPLLSGQGSRFLHFEEIQLLTSPAEIYRGELSSHKLFIVSAEREEILSALLKRFWDAKISRSLASPELGIILTGKQPLKTALLEQIEKAQIPALYTPLSSFAVLKQIHTTTTKIRTGDKEKIEEAIHLVEENVDFPALLQAIKA